MPSFLSRKNLFRGLLFVVVLLLALEIIRLYRK